MLHGGDSAAKEPTGSKLLPVENWRRRDLSSLFMRSTTSQNHSISGLGEKEACRRHSLGSIDCEPAATRPNSSGASTSICDFRMIWSKPVRIACTDASSTMLDTISRIFCRLNACKFAFVTSVSSFVVGSINVRQSDSTSSVSSTTLIDFTTAGSTSARSSRVNASHFSLAMTRLRKTLENGIGKTALPKSTTCARSSPKHWSSFSTLGRSIPSLRLYVRASSCVNSWRSALFPSHNSFAIKLNASRVGPGPPETSPDGCRKPQLRCRIFKIFGETDQTFTKKSCQASCADKVKLFERAKFA
mmetsp:Transcript_2834/g.10894  ORF Transcript_2834/g.10894 Transcript_2834/m.10894 type:complete len:302 (+) Transcript_2834:244-1149(+)